MMSIEGKKKEANNIFEKLPLPREREEAWRHTSIEHLPIQNFLTLSEPKIELSPLTEAEESKGVLFCTMKEAMVRHPEKVLSHYLKTFKTKDKLIALSLSQWSNGVFLYVPKGVHVEFPFHVKMTIKKNATLFNLIVLEENSSANFMEEYVYETEQESLSASCTEVQVGAHAQLHFHYLCESTPNQRSFHSIQAQAKANSAINWHWAGFGGKLNRLRIDTELIGNGATSENRGVFIGKQKAHNDATTNIFHLAENTTSNMEINGIMKDSSSAIYRGLIKIDKVARGTNSYLSNHILKLSDRAIANSIPALEIDNNEVKASHGATVGQIDEEQMFYLKSRGLSQKDAENLIVEGFLMPIVEKIKIESFREKFTAALERGNAHD